MRRPAAFHDGWLRSATWPGRDDDGFFYIVDRKKDMIISGGFNIYAREVEDVLTTHPAIANAAVIAIPDDKWGEAVHAIIVTRPGMTVDRRELADYVKSRKGAMYAPKSLEAVDTLPTTTVGKTDKQQLRAHTGRDRTGRSTDHKQAAPGLVDPRNPPHARATDGRREQQPPIPTSQTCPNVASTIRGHSPAPQADGASRGPRRHLACSRKRPLNTRHPIRRQPMTSRCGRLARPSCRSATLPCGAGDRTTTPEVRQCRH